MNNYYNHGEILNVVIEWELKWKQTIIDYRSIEYKEKYAAGEICSLYL